jgi:hypothetical protein
MSHQNEVQEALRLIRLIRKHPAQQSPQAERKVLSRLSVDVYLEVLSILDKENANPDMGGAK